MARTTRNEVLFLRLGAALLGAGLAGAALIPSAAAEPAACLSMDPSQWPSPSKPYFTVIVDTSGVDGLRRGEHQQLRLPEQPHRACAVRREEHRRGLRRGELRPRRLRVEGDRLHRGRLLHELCRHLFADRQQFPRPPRRRVEPGRDQRPPGREHLPADAPGSHYWAPPPSPPNVPAIVSWVDNNCTGSTELGADSNTPLGGVLYNMNQYFSGAFKDPFGAGYPNNAAFTSPLGTLAQGERSCRSVNVILDHRRRRDLRQRRPRADPGGCAAGSAYPNNNFQGLASYEADRMFTTGVTFGGQNFKVKTHVIGFVGATIASLDNIAKCGGTTKSYSTGNEQQLSQALANIIASAIQPETCDNIDNNCNGCTDEGFNHYCDVRPDLLRPARRATCLANYQASITPRQAAGRRHAAPLHRRAPRQPPATWLCYDPATSATTSTTTATASVDEGDIKCGSPLHCPQPEICNGLDDNCNGVGRRRAGGAYACAPTCASPPEICDGCDNDCDGIVDDGVRRDAALRPARLAAGQLRRRADLQAAGSPCPRAPAPRAAATDACSTDPAARDLRRRRQQLQRHRGRRNRRGAPACRRARPRASSTAAPASARWATQACIGGARASASSAPAPEICDGLDNDCDGKVDNGVVGVGQAVRRSTRRRASRARPPCVAGALVCRAASGRSPRCATGSTTTATARSTTAPLADAPGPGHDRLLGPPGNCCSFPDVNPTLHWCPPAGAHTATALGTLTRALHRRARSPAPAPRAGCARAPKDPAAETCDGLDNNCNGDDRRRQPARRRRPSAAATSASARPASSSATAGVLDCAGTSAPRRRSATARTTTATAPSTTASPTGGPCTPAYDIGGVPRPAHQPALPARRPPVRRHRRHGVHRRRRPAAEVCDGIDNDCDGRVDEAGMAPDGIDGSANPNPSAAARQHRRRLRRRPGRVHARQAGLRQGAVPVQRRQAGRSPRSATARTTTATAPSTTRTRNAPPHLQRRARTA